MVSISQERQRLADIGMRLISRETWGSRYDYRNARAVVEPATRVFVHISVTNPGAYNSHAAHVRGIEAIGIARFPNTGISYNRVIVFGVNTAYEAQPMGRRGAHTVNDHRRSTCTRFVNQCPGYKGDLTAPSWNLNYNARAYVYGAFCGASFTDSVLDTMARAIAADKRAGLVTRDAKIHGHRCVSSKSCPCDQVWARMHELDRRIEHYLRDEPEDDMPSPKDWTNADWDAFQGKIAGALRFRGVATAPNGEEWSAAHALSWLMGAVAGLSHTVGENEAAVAMGAFQPGKVIRPDKALEYSWAYGKMSYRALLNQVIPELAALSAEGAAREQLIRDLQQCDVQLSDEQVDRLVAGAAAAGQRAVQQVLDRLAAAGDALAADEDDA